MHRQTLEGWHEHRCGESNISLCPTCSISATSTSCPRSACQSTVSPHRASSNASTTPQWSASGHAPSSGNLLKRQPASSPRSERPPDQERSADLTLFPLTLPNPSFPSHKFLHPQLMSCTHRSRILSLKNPFPSTDHFPAEMGFELRLISDTFAHPSFSLRNTAAFPARYSTLFSFDVRPAVLKEFAQPPILPQYPTPPSTFLCRN
ncbi:hypothetical protein C8Q74DRAFT_169719 [Fomes fomentarius]|nr:hypothetical protein C8Q74DRAFT_169719 [Fomes fomentarius]